MMSQATRRICGFLFFGKVMDGVGKVAAEFSLDRLYKLSLLYDFYGELLKESSRQMFEDYVLNNYSLAEIAQERGISRQGVHDAVRRASIQLEEYEQRLGLLKKFQKTKEIVGDIQSLVQNPEEKTAEALRQNMRQVQELSKVILTEI